MDNQNNKNNDSSKKQLLVSLACIAGFFLIIVTAYLVYNNIIKSSNHSAKADKDFIENLSNAENKLQHQNESNDTPDKNPPPAQEESDKKNSGANNESQNSTDGKAESADKPNGSNTDNGGNDSEYMLAPDFTVYTKDKKAVKLHNKFGKPIIINFWATWCGPCKKEMPHFERAYKEYGDKIEFMMINPTDGANDTHESVDKFLKDNGYTFPVYRDTESDAVMKYGISAFPTTFFINSDGYLLGYYPGTMSEETLYACIDIVMGNAE